MFYCSNYLNSVLFIALAILTISCKHKDSKDSRIFDAGSYVVYSDSIVEGDKQVVVLNPGTLESNFNCVDPLVVPDTLRFRFAINGQDNEMGYSYWHKQSIGCPDSLFLHQFGIIVDQELTTKNNRSLKDSVLIRLDMRPIINDFSNRGYYVTKTQDTIFKEYFNGVWIVSNDRPLHRDLALKMHDRGDTIYESTIHFDGTVAPNYFNPFVSVKSLPTSYPAFTSKINILNTAYNIAINRVDSIARSIVDSKDIVSTTSISKAITLMSGILPHELSIKLLKKCIEHGRIRQDDGEAGGWPIASDRMIWTSAAYEEFLASADSSWLKYAFDVSCRTLDDVINVQSSPTNSLLYGSSSMDGFPLYTYPYWMKNKDVFESQCLLSNVIYYRSLCALSEMASILGESKKAIELEKLKNNVGYSLNLNLWLPDIQRFSEYLYCAPYQIQSESSDNLGQAFCILYGPATEEMSKAIINSTPLSCYGIQRVYPVDEVSAKSDIGGHLVDTATQAFWSMACAKSKNMKALALSNFSLLRAVLFSGFSGAKINPENGFLVYEEKDKEYNELLSSASIIALIYKVIFGFEISAKRIAFHPCITSQLGDYFSFKDFRLFGSTFDIVIKGCGDNAASMFIDGKKNEGFISPDNFKDVHQIVIDMTEVNRDLMTLRNDELAILPEIPIVIWNKNRSSIVNFNENELYDVLINGEITDQTNKSVYNFSSYSNCSFLQIQATLKNVTGLASAPHIFVNKANILMVSASQLGETGTNLPVREGLENAYIEISPYRNSIISFKVNSVKDGNYFMTVRYSNGAGDKKSQTQCVIRGVFVNGNRVGTLIFPANGDGNWIEFKDTNGVALKLNKGLNIINIEFRPPFDFNSAKSAGTALIESIKLIRLD